MSQAHLPGLIDRLERILRGDGSVVHEDGELLVRFLLRKDEAAFEALLWRHGPMVLGVCRRLLDDVHAAEDAFQATFLLLARKAASIRKSESLASWLYKVAYRAALRARRRAHLHASIFVPLNDIPAAPAPDRVLAQEVRPLLDQAIQRLPERYRQAVILCDLQGKLLREAAVELGCPIGTVSTRRIRAHAMLRKDLARRGATLSGGAIASGIAQQNVRAAVPPALAAATRAGMRAVLGPGATKSAISQGVRRLMSETGTGFIAGKLKLGILCTIAIAVAVAGVVAGRQLTNELPRSGATPSRRPSAAIASSGQVPTAATSRDEFVSVRGRVVDPDGRPIAGARILSPHAVTSSPDSADDLRLVAYGSSGKDGSFATKLPSADTRHPFGPALIAYANGFGIAWAELSRTKPPYDFTLRLAKDLPIRGRIINTENRPLTGVRVSVVAVYGTDGRPLDDFVAKWKNQEHRSLSDFPRELLLPNNDVLPGSHTDSSGRFELRGAGADRLVVLKAEGGGAAPNRLYVFTQTGFDAAPYNAAAARLGGTIGHAREVAQLFGPDLHYVAAPTRVLEGTVRDADTGKPLAGIAVESGFAYAGMYYKLCMTSDGNGRYQFRNLPMKYDAYPLRTQPDPRSEWLPAFKLVTGPGTLGPIRADLGLVHGIRLRGRLTDLQTGKGICGSISACALTASTKLKNRPGYEAYFAEPCLAVRTETDDEGNYQLATMPGRLVIQAIGYGTDRIAAGSFRGSHLNPYRPAEFSAADRPHVVETRDVFDQPIAAVRDKPAIHLTGCNACKFMDLPEDATTAECNFALDPGRRLKLTIVDPDGKPLDGALAVGLRATEPTSVPGAFPLTGSSCTVYALDPGQPREVLFFHKTRRLAGGIVLRGDEMDPLTMHLGPLGSVTGRLVNAQGKPLSGIEVHLWQRMNLANLRVAADGSEAVRPVRTGNDGRFRHKDLVPNVDFGLAFLHEGKRFEIEGRIGLRRVAPGATLDLGNIRSKSPNE